MAPIAARPLRVAIAGGDEERGDAGDLLGIPVAPGTDDPSQAQRGELAKPIWRGAGLWDSGRSALGHARHIGACPWQVRSRPAAVETRPNVRSEPNLTEAG